MVIDIHKKNRHISIGEVNISDERLKAYLQTTSW